MVHLGKLAPTDSSISLKSLQKGLDRLYGLYYNYIRIVSIKSKT
jgi:hypothetical protein